MVGTNRRTAIRPLLYMCRLCVSLVLRSVFRSGLVASVLAAQRIGILLQVGSQLVEQLCPAIDIRCRLAE